MTSKLSIQLASLPDREFLVAEIWLGDIQIAELNQEGHILTLEMYPSRDGKPWRLPFPEFLTTLNEAAESLVGSEPVT